MTRTRHFSFFDTLLETIAHFRMWAPGAKILLAVSGGSDSMALLHSLMDLGSLHGAALGVIHLNHGLRPEAGEEEAFVKNSAKSLNLPFFSKKADLEKTFPNLSVEEAGREARYAFFEEIRKKEGFDHIVTAHHADDQVEQILMNLVRGCGLDGLSGIAAVQGNIVRPLIRIHKRELSAYLVEKKIPWREDASNKDLRFLRNRIRHELFPLLEKNFNPAIRKNLLHLGGMASEDKLFWRHITEKTFQECILEKEDHSLRLSMETLETLPPALQARVLRHAIEIIKGDLLAIGKTHVDSIRNLLSQRESKILHFPGRIKITLSRGILEIQKMPHSLRQREKTITRFEKNISLPTFFPIEIPLPEGLGRLLLDLETECFSEGNVLFLPEAYFPVSVRDLRPGDRIRAFGRVGSKKVFPFLAEKGYPHQDRSKRPVLMHEGKILWIPGLPPSFDTTQKGIRILWIHEKTESIPKKPCDF